jgi:hypothetical protein
VAFANHLFVDLSTADPKMTYGATVAINGHDAHLDLFAENLV